MNRIRLVAVDIDGTLTSTPKSVSPRTVQAVCNAMRQGIYTTIATGRSYFGSRAILEQLCIDGPCIVYGGAITADARTGAIERALYLSPDTVRDILEAARTIGVHAQIYRSDVVVTEKDCAAFQKYCNYIGLPREVDPSIRTSPQSEVPKILVIVPPEVDGKVQLQMEAMLGSRVRITRSQPGFVEINDPNATKANALQALAGRMGLTQAEVCAVGDSYLDIDMIEWAGLGACVKNGVPEALAAADRILPSCQEDGVAALIEELAASDGNQD